MLLRYYLTPAKLLHIAGVLWRNYGIRLPCVVIARFAVYGWCVLFRTGKTFNLDGRHYSYALNLQNATFRIERAVEIPVALQMFQLTGDILEVGNVLSQYCRFHHDVVDKYEQCEGVQNVDIIDYHPEKRYDLIISVSTLEHVGWDEVPKEPEKLLTAVQNMKNLLKPGGRMILTVPLGYNDYLDSCLQTGLFGLSRVMYMKRISARNDWEQTTLPDAMGRKYGSRYPCANAIAIGIYERLN